MYYDGTKILNMLDLHNKKPEIFLIMTNRSAGKSTYFYRYVVKKFLKENKQFCLIYRYSYELKNVAEKFFNDIQTLFFPNHTMKSTVKNGESYAELKIDNKLCGYGVCLNKASSLKNCSHLFNKIDYIIFDEFQEEFDNYVPNEISKFISLHNTIARGQYKQSRYVPVFMLSNRISLINPYFTEFNCSHRIQQNTKFLRGEGWVLETQIYDSAKKAQENSVFNKAFTKHNYITNLSENKYLNDSNNFIDKLSGKNIYIATLKYNNKIFSIKNYAGDILFCSDSYDISFPRKICCTQNDHDTDFIHNPALLVILRDYFKKGLFRFQNLECKKAILTLLSY